MRPVRAAQRHGGGSGYCDCTFPYFLSRLSGIPDTRKSVPERRGGGCGDVKEKWFSRPSPGLKIKGLNFLRHANELTGRML